MTFTTTFSHSSKLTGRVGSGLLLIFILAALSACQPSIELLQPGSQIALPSVATVVPAAHSIALIGVDFDPPLDYNQIVSNGGLTLLVAIGNLGHSREAAVQVTATLLDSAEAPQTVELLNETVTAKALAPGEVRVVRFSQVSELPVRDRYKLVVEVSPVAGELDLDDNSRTFDIIVRDTR